MGSPSPVLQQPHNQRLPSQPDYRQVQLFDPERSQFPSPTLMPHFIQLFFEKHASDYSFISYDQIMSDFWENRLSPVTANIIASMATKCVNSMPCFGASVANTTYRFSNMAELTMKGLHSVAETYAEVARVCSHYTVLRSCC